jgi:type I restriction enzyme S subunit
LKISQVFDFKNYVSSGNYFEKGHILYSRMRPYLNKVTKANFEGAASGEYIVLECKESIVNDYLMYILHSGTFVNYTNQRSVGDRPRLSFEDLAAFQFHLKNIQEQKQAVNDIERYFTIIENLHETLKKTESQIVTLRQSILKKAFEGRLISPLESNESANELLELIRKEKLQYLKNQQEIAKNSPKKQKAMEEKKSILEILQSTDTPLRTEDVWLQSAQKENIEEFYAELKKIQSQIIATKKNAESFLSLKK